MNTNTYTIRPLSDDEILSVYTNTAPRHFPAGELRPIDNIKYLLSTGGYEGLGIFKGDSRLLGYALFLHVPEADTILLDFYAILEEYRSLGLGSRFLQEMKKHYHRLAGILLETEDPAFAETEAEKTERTRRNAFYYKNGARDTGIFCTLFGVPFQILFLPVADTLPAGQPDSPLLREKLDAVYHFMLTEERYREGVFWR